jgi:hypothetical protein
MEPGSVLELPAEHEERGVYLVQGNVAVDGNVLPEKNLARLPEGKSAQIHAKTQSRVMLLGGSKMDGRRFIWWNFVASSQALIEEAKQRWREQRFAAVPGEREFIPLPER